MHDAGALCDALRRWHRCPELHKAIDGINYIADQTRKEEESTRVSRGPGRRPGGGAPTVRPALKLASRAGQGGLEVRGDGARPAVPVDLHAGRGGRVGGHHPAGADAVRRARAHRRAPLGDRVRHGQAAAAAAAAGPALTPHASGRTLLTFLMRARCRRGRYVFTVGEAGYPASCPPLRVLL